MSAAEAGGRSRHRARETNSIVERCNRSFKHEHLYRREIGQAAELALDPARRSTPMSGIESPTSLTQDTTIDAFTHRRRRAPSQSGSRPAAPEGAPRSRAS